MLQAGRMIQKLPGKFELCLQRPPECLHSEHFGRVVSGVKEIDAEFFCRGEGPMRSLAGDESIDASFGCLAHFSTCRSSDHSDSSSDGRPTGSKVDLSSDGSLEIFSEQVAFNLHVNLEADLKKAVPDLWKAECVAEQSIIPISGVSVQWQVSAVNCDVVRHGKL